MADLTSGELLYGQSGPHHPPDPDPDFPVVGTVRYELHTALDGHRRCNASSASRCWVRCGPFEEWTAWPRLFVGNGIPRRPGTVALHD